MANSLDVLKLLHLLYTLLVTFRYTRAIAVELHIDYNLTIDFHLDFNVYI